MPGISVNQFITLKGVSRMLAKDLVLALLEVDLRAGFQVCLHIGSCQPSSHKPRLSIRRYVCGLNNPSAPYSKSHVYGLTFSLNDLNSD